jgi:hypothetical protein
LVCIPQNTPRGASPYHPSYNPKRASTKGLMFQSSGVTSRSLAADAIK